MAEVTIIGEIELAPGREEAGLEFLKGLCETTHAEDEGCLLYALHRVADDPNRIVMIERWASPEAHAAHVGAAGVAAYREFDGLETARVVFLEPAGYGQPELGRL